MKAAKKFCFNILLKAILPRYSRSINYKKALEFKNIKILPEKYTMCGFLI